MDININFRIINNNNHTEEILTKVNQLGEQMATIQEVIDAVSAQQMTIQEDLSAVSTLLTEVRQLLAQGDTVAADALLQTVQANTQALTDSITAITDVTASVDAANGDPQPA